MKFKLPLCAFWEPEDWSGMYECCNEIVDNTLGWDLTDFGFGNFMKQGLLLFTIQNRNPQKGKKTYAEKVMIVEEDQKTPMHFHWSKMEDIINHGGGNLVIELYRSDRNEGFSNEKVIFKTDGVTRSVAPGGAVILTPDESICLEQGLFHRFYGEKGKGKVLVGEVSAINDDNTDNLGYVSIKI